MFCTNEACKRDIWEKILNKNKNPETWIVVFVVRLLACFVFVPCFDCCMQLIYNWNNKFKYKWARQIQEKRNKEKKRKEKEQIFYYLIEINKNNNNKCLKITNSSS
jgi:hypothetical protein